MSEMHGGDLKSFSEKFGKKESEIFDFSSNINPLGYPESVIKLFPNLIKEMALYPDPKARDLRQEVARHYPLWPENVIAGNGSLALLALAIRTLAPKKALLIEPCFGQYRHLLNQQKTEIRGVLLRESDQFQFNLAEILNGLRGVDLMIIGHPNNPTGTALSRQDLLDVLEQAHRENVYTIVDEAYADWTPEISVARDIKDSSYFMVIRSLTEFYAFAGIRCGYALGSKRLIQKMQAQQELWSCNRLAQKLGIAALQDIDFAQQSLEWYRDQSSFFLRKLESLGVFKVYPSLTNFFLVKIKHHAVQLEAAASASPADHLFQYLGEKKVFIRTVKDFAGLDSSYFRTAVLDLKRNESLIRHLKSWTQNASVQGRFPSASDKGPNHPSSKKKAVVSKESH